MMVARNILMVVLVVFLDCTGRQSNHDLSSTDQDMRQSTREVQFWGFSERENELIAYVIQVPNGGSDIYYDGQSNPNWGDDWERKIVTVYEDGSTIFITNQYYFGGLNALLRKTMPDSTYNDPRPLKHGMFESTYWKEIRTKDIVVGYEFVPEEKLELFEKCINSLCTSKKLRNEILKKIPMKIDSVLEVGS